MCGAEGAPRAWPLTAERCGPPAVNRQRPRRFGCVSSGCLVLTWPTHPRETPSAHAKAPPPRTAQVKWKVVVTELCPTHPAAAFPSQLLSKADSASSAPEEKQSKQECFLTHLQRRRKAGKFSDRFAHQQVLVQGHWSAGGNGSRQRARAEQLPGNHGFPFVCVPSCPTCIYDMKHSEIDFTL